MTANFKRLSSVEQPFFIFNSRLVITAELLISLPAAECVKTHATGIASIGFLFPIAKSHTSQSAFAPSAVYLHESITLPPPTASIISTFSRFATAIASLTKVILGFGSTPPISTNSIALLLSEALIVSKRPLFITLAFPYWSIIFL